MKILDADFRKGLYKDLVEAGYAKEEAQRIVGKKYFESLKSSLCEKLKNTLGFVEEDKFEDTEQFAVELPSMLSELTKLREVVAPTAIGGKRG